MSRSSATLKPLEKQPLQRVLHMARQWIDTGVWRPGEKIPSEYRIARSLGISRSTVHNALESLEEEGVLTRLEGRGRTVAEGLSDTRGPLAHTIGIVAAPFETAYMPDHGKGWGSALTLSVFDNAEAAGRQCLTLNPEHIREDRGEALWHGGLAGMMILYGAFQAEGMEHVVHWLRDRRMPVVVQNENESVPGVDAVGSDHEAGGYAMASALFGRGCRRLLCYWAPDDCRDRGWMQARIAGVERAHRERGLPSPETIHPLHQTFENSDSNFETRTRLAVGQLHEAFSADESPDAILVQSDRDAFHVSAALRVFHKTPQADVLVAGYDDYWRDYCDLKREPHPLTLTMNKQNALIGQRLLETLEARIANPAAPVVQTVVPPRLVWAETKGLHHKAEEKP